MNRCSNPRCTEPEETRGLCESHYRKKVRMGIYRNVDASAAREHVAALRSLGWTYEAIAEVSGLSTYVPHKVATGQTRMLRFDSAQALLAVPLTPYDSHRGVDSAGTRRRVQALAWMGWPCEEVARRSGTTRRALATLILPNRRISFALARRVAAVYDDLCMTSGPSRVTAGKARGLGFLPPLAWDETELDDPLARPKRGRIREVAA